MVVIAADLTAALSSAASSTKLGSKFVFNKELPRAVIKIHMSLISNSFGKQCRNLNGLVYNNNENSRVNAKANS